mmetsp:Transcript_22635/g.63132  ORF Transcript_22635/g.63132 Transcript_22635/m.63132 type:complete len:84 (+) Transcript_22635:549-800(+)
MHKFSDVPAMVVFVFVFVFVFALTLTLTLSGAAYALDERRKRIRKEEIKEGNGFCGRSLGQRAILGADKSIRTLFVWSACVCV